MLPKLVRMIFREYISPLLSKQMSLDSAIRKAMGGVRPARDFLRPTKRPRFSDISQVSFPSAQSMQGVNFKDGTINLHTNDTVTIRTMPKVRRGDISWTQGALIFYNMTEDQYIELEKVNSLLRGLQFRRTVDQVYRYEEALALDRDVRELYYLRLRSTNFNFLGVFRNVMPNSLKTRQPVIGLDVFGRTNVLDLTKQHPKVGDSLFLALTILRNNNGNAYLQFIPCLNREFPGPKPHDEIKTNVQGGKCIATNVLGYMHIGTVIHRPGRRKQRNRKSAWKVKTQADAMNHVEIILA